MTLRAATLARPRSRVAWPRALGLGLAVASIVTFVLFPYGWILLNSLKSEADLLTAGVSDLPARPTLENYRLLFEREPFAGYFLNSFGIAGATTALSLFVAVAAAYSFSRYRFHGRNVLLTAILLKYMVPGILLLIPLFVILRGFGLLDTRAAVVLAHSTHAVPFSIWMLVGYFNALPRELEEAGMVDGAGRVEAFVRLLLPVALPGIVATGIFIFILSWNEFLFAVTFLNSKALQTLPIGLWTVYGGETRIYWGMITAAGVVTSLPVAGLFMLFQRWLVRGLTAGALKA
jgi:multiple sugar transport system permease protein